MTSCTLHPFQEDALNNLNILAKEGDYRTILSIPTGGGKTVVTIQFLLTTMFPNDYKVLWLANSKHLVGQAVSWLRFQDNSITAKKVVSGTSISDYPEDLQFMGMTYQYATFHINELQEYYRGKKLLMVIDEAHHSCASSYINLIEDVPKFTTNFSLLGLTATPFRTIEEETPRLAELYGDGVKNGIRTDSSIAYSISLTELIKLGILAKPTIFKYSVECSNSLVYSFNMTEDKLDIQNNLSMDKIFNRSIADIYVKQHETFGKTIIFAINQKQAITIWQLLLNRGINAGIAISVQDREKVKKYNLSKESVEEYIKDFRKDDGTIEVLVTCKMISEGFDVPKTKTVILTKPMISKIECTQCVGRALRNKEEESDNSANIVYFDTAINGFSIQWVTPEEILQDEYVMCKKGMGSTKGSSLHGLEDYVKTTLNGNGVSYASISGELNMVSGYYVYRDTDHNIKQLVTYQSNNDVFRNFIDKIETYTEDSLDNLSKNLMSDILHLPITKQDLSGILNYYKETGNKPVYYENNETTNALLDLDRQASGVQEVSMRQGKEQLTDIWLKELILQYRYRTSDEFISKVMTRM